MLSWLILMRRLRERGGNYHLGVRRGCSAHWLYSGDSSVVRVRVVGSGSTMILLESNNVGSRSYGEYVQC